MTNKVNVKESPMRKYVITGIFTIINKFSDVDVYVCICVLQKNKYVEMEDVLTNLDRLI